MYHAMQTVGAVDEYHWRIASGSDLLTHDEVARLLNTQAEQIEKLQSSIPELPPVAPDNLVEGEWYDFIFDGERLRGVFTKIHSSERRLMLRTVLGMYQQNDAEAIYGPLPKFKIGGAE